MLLGSMVEAEKEARVSTGHQPDWQALASLAHTETSFSGQERLDPIPRRVESSCWPLPYNTQKEKPSEAPLSQLPRRFPRLASSMVPTKDSIKRGKC